MKQDTWIKRRVGDHDYNNIVKQLIEMIPRGRYDACFGIPRGGLIPATWISYQLDIGLITEYGVHTVPKERILIVDDIADTGDTLFPFVEAGYDTACLFYKSRSIVKPTYYVNQCDQYWLVFPYENDDEPINREF